MDLLNQSTNTIDVVAQEAARPIVRAKRWLARVAYGRDAEANRIGEALPGVVAVLLFIPRNGHAQPVEEPANLGWPAGVAAIPKRVPPSFRLRFCSNATGRELMSNQERSLCPANEPDAMWPVSIQA